MQLSEKALAISPSLTLKITAMAKDMKKRGLDVVGFGAGEPDFDTPQHIKDAAIEALKIGMTKYTPASGTVELKKAVCKDLKKHGLSYDPAQIVISNGAKHSLFNVFQAILNPGDEVIVITPYWLTYPELIKMADGVPVYVGAHECNNFEPLAKDIEAAVTQKTKAIIVNNPSNPCGCIYSQKTLEDIAAVAKKHDFFIVSDEIYDELVYDDNKHTSIAAISEDAYERTILVNGLSKTYAMTGWRIGYTASRADIAKVMGSYQSHATSNPCSIAQFAGIAALTGPRDEIIAMREEFNARRKMMVEMINKIDGLSCVTPMGAFYVMLNISDIKGRKLDGEEIKGSVDFAEKLLEKKLTAVIPGAAFGADDFVRLSYAISRENIEKGLGRIAEFVAMLD
ncbi:MAG: pyridoxal phosphate-dependent aminotransferase [Christensenella sp.]|uniref:pyridoxal phosphate-dependent aminotransferase n=1 Tax=Christensenella sp. TaxID=1935934 RepID=UPI002B1EC1D3|nr:pyridoxal phosphate-dependent aminotransferase [Christensenella sp.]MEA5003043.1 pyridoxal phosphate-dependent aminotransferase [Christensenella sp.]